MDKQRAPRATELLLAWLKAGPHDTVLAVGETSARLLALVSAGRPETPLCAEITTVVPAEQWLQPMPSRPRFDAALASDVVETLSEATATRLLAGLRDIHAGRLLLFAAESSRGASTDLLALGLRGLGSVSTDRAYLSVYGYDLRNYKRTPDWLNSRNWAHPERWGRHRW